MLRVTIVPAQPPLPTASNFPFHTSANGNQASISICESEDGVSTAQVWVHAGIMASGGQCTPAKMRRNPMRAFYSTQKNFRAFILGTPEGWHVSIYDLQKRQWAETN